MLTQARLKQLFSYDPDTGIFTRLFVPGLRTDRLMQPIYSPTNGYLAFAVDGVKYKAHRLAWLYMTGEWPKGLIDHKNGVKGDNRFDNLREASQAQNMRNQGLQAHNSSGFTGVYWNKCAAKWQAYIKVDRKVRYLGIFEVKEDAVAARRVAEIEYFGEFAPRAA